MAELTAPEPHRRLLLRTRRAGRRAASRARRPRAAGPAPPAAPAAAPAGDAAETLRETVRERYAAAALATTDPTAAAGCCATAPDHRRAGRAVRRRPLRRRRTRRAARRRRARLARLRQPDRDGRPARRARPCSTSAPAAASTCCSPPAASAPPARAYGLDMTDEMLDLARANAAKAGVENVAVRSRATSRRSRSPPTTVDVVHLQLRDQPLRRQAAVVLRETARVLKPGGRFAVSDVIADAGMDDATRADMAQCDRLHRRRAHRATSTRAALADAGLTDVEITRPTASTSTPARRSSAPASRDRHRGSAARGGLDGGVSAGSDVSDQRARGSGRGLCARASGQPRTLSPSAAATVDASRAGAEGRPARRQFVRAGRARRRCSSWRTSSLRCRR